MILRKETDILLEALSRIQNFAEVPAIGFALTFLMLSMLLLVKILLGMSLLQWLLILSMKV